jgi:hypothetical protein
MSVRWCLERLRLCAMLRHPSNRAPGGGITTTGPASEAQAGVRSGFWLPAQPPARMHTPTHALHVLPNTQAGTALVTVAAAVDASSVDKL